MYFWLTKKRKFSCKYPNLLSFDSFFFFFFFFVHFNSMLKEWNIRLSIKQISLLNLYKCSLWWIKIGLEQEYYENCLYIYFVCVRILIYFVCVCVCVYKSIYFVCVCINLFCMCVHINLFTVKIGSSWTYYFTFCFVWVLWHINPCRLFNAKSCFIIYIYIYIYNL